MVRAEDSGPFLREGECGGLVTSLPRNGQLTAYGMLIGQLEQEAYDGGDPVELYIAFPLKEAIEELIQRGVFKGRTPTFMGTQVVTVISCKPIDGSSVSS